MKDNSSTVCEVVSVDVSHSKQSKSPTIHNNMTVKILKVVKDESSIFKIKACGNDGSKVRKQMAHNVY